MDYETFEREVEQDLRKSLLRYSHLAPEHLRQAVAVLDDVLPAAKTEDPAAQLVEEELAGPAEGPSSRRVS